MPLVTVQDVAEKAFDYVVIGGGSAGLVLAARLSDDPNTSILVLDAGKPNFGDALIIRPGQYGRTFMNPDYDWAFKTVPQDNLGGREVLWNRGKSLGGSSAINFSCWSVPPKEDIDDWERLGNSGWNWKTYENCLRRVATYHSNGESDATSDIPERVEAMKPWEAGWGQGPLKISHPKNILDIEFRLQETWVKLGLPRAQASYAGSPNGVSLIANTLDPESNGRSYAATAFFKPNESRPNLEVLTSAAVSRIETENVGDALLMATTVEFWHTGENGTTNKYSVKVKKEVVICAGALKSPQILELSGIGRPDILDSLGVEVKLPLEGVGENVQDHTFLGVTYALKDDFEGDTYDVLSDPEVAAKQVELFKEKKGVFMMGICSMAYTGLSTVCPRSEDLLKQTRERIEGEVKDGLYSNARLEQYKIILQRLKNGAPGFEFIGFPGVLSGPNAGKAGKKYFTIIVATNYSFNRGTIHTTSKEITVDPAYDPKYLDYDIDLKVIVDMVKYTRKVFKTSPLAEYFEETPVELNPGAEAQTDAEIEEWVKATIGTTYHVIGSLSMLPKEKGGVVDSNLKVYGTQNIRVADLSIVPLHFAAHSVATAYTIGQYAADIIRGT